MAISRNKNFTKLPKPKKELINEFIPFNEILVINENDEKIGIMSLQAAIEYARSINLDVFCVAPNAKPPVCKVLNYGKHKYTEAKNLKLQKKNQKIVKVKEIRLTFRTSNHDVEIKAKRAIKFLEDNNRVKVSLQFRGREKEKVEIGLNIINKIIELLKDFGLPEKTPALNGRFLDVLVIPNKK